MDGQRKLKAAMTTGTEQHLSLSFQTFLERTREAITFSFPHRGLDLMTRSNISLAYDVFLDDSGWITHQLPSWLLEDSGHQRLGQNQPPQSLFHGFQSAQK